MYILIPTTQSTMAFIQHEQLNIYINRYLIFCITLIEQWCKQSLQIYKSLGRDILPRSCMQTLQALDWK